MNKQKKGLKAILALLLTLALIIGMVPTSVLAAGQTKVADTDTRYDYESFLGDNNSTQYAGRVWTDKSVSTGDVVFTGTKVDENGTEQPINTKVKIGNSDFLVTYSALATSQEITRLPKIPVDVVFVLDFSASMCWGQDSEGIDPDYNNNATAAREDSRILAMVNALNSSIQTLVDDNDNNRIGIAVFSGTSTTMLELTDASTIKNGNYDEIGGINQYLTVGDFAKPSLGNTSKRWESSTTVSCHIPGGEDVGTAGGTNIQAGLYEGMSMLTDPNLNTTYTYEGNKTTYSRIPNVVLMSDGAPTTFASANTTYYVDSGNSYSKDDGYVDENTNLSENYYLNDEDQKNVSDETLRSRPLESGNWWEGVSNVEIGGGDNYTPDSADGFMALLTASYMKNAITNKYTSASGISNADKAAANVYTIGFSTNLQTSGMAAMADLVLNPADNWTKEHPEFNGEQNRDLYQKAIDEVIDGWDTYKKDSSPLVYGDMGASSDYPKYYQVAIADDNNNPDSLYYPDEYFSAENADDLNNAFQQITSTITESAKAPTETNPNNPAGSGYITYTDTIGDYMQVDDVKALIWAGEEFNNVTASTNGNVTTYTFKRADGSTSIDSPVYGQHDVNHIIVTITRNPDKKEVLKVEIPANSIPLRVNYVEVNADDTVASNTNNGALPLRLCYTVGLKPEIKGAVDQATGLLDLEKIADDTLKTQLESMIDANGNLTFYSNAFDANTDKVGETTVGNATVEFTPADDNPFYFIQEDTPLYTDEACTQRAESFDASRTYYFKIAYYDTKDAEGNPYPNGETQLTTVVVERSGSLLNNWVDKVNDSEGYYIIAGAPRLGNLQDFTQEKDPIYGENGVTVIQAANITGTAETYFYPTFNGVPDTGSFKVYLGNNGKLTVPTEQQTGSITITKTDGAGEPLEGAGFTLFEKGVDGTYIPVDLNTADGTTPNQTDDGKYPYEQIVKRVEVVRLTQAEQAQIQNGEITVGGVTYPVHTRKIDETNSETFYYKPLADGTEPAEGNAVEYIVEFKDLDINKTYRVVETTVPDNYMQNSTDHIVINDLKLPLEASSSTGVGSDVTTESGTNGTTSVYHVLYTVVNHRNISLPSSGLGGVTTLLMIGVVLVVAGAGYLILRKRKVN